jgi:hypothetical protein
LEDGWQVSHCLSQRIEPGLEEDGEVVRLDQERLGTLPVSGDHIDLLLQIEHVLAIRCHVEGTHQRVEDTPNLWERVTQTAWRAEGFVSSHARGDAFKIVTNPTSAFARLEPDLPDVLHSVSPSVRRYEHILSTQIRKCSSSASSYSFRIKENAKTMSWQVFRQGFSAYWRYG